MAFMRKSLMNWLRTIDRLLKGKLLSSLAIHKNVWVKLLMFFLIQFVQDEFLHADSRNESLKSWNLPATLQERRWGISLQYYDSHWNVGASLWTWDQASAHGISSQIFTCEKKIKTQALAGKVMATVFGTQVMLFTWTALNLWPPSTDSATLQYCKLWSID